MGKATTEVRKIIDVITNNKSSSSLCSSSFASFNIKENIKKNNIIIKSDSISLVILF